MRRRRTRQRKKRRRDAKEARSFPEAEQETVTLELYRQSTIGKCLVDCLDEMVMNDTLEPELAIKVLVQFDKSIAEALEIMEVSMTSKKQRKKRTVSIKGHLYTHRFCDSVWTFVVHDAVIKTKYESENVQRVKIVAMDSKLFRRFKEKFLS